MDDSEDFTDADHPLEQDSIENEAGDSGNEEEGEMVAGSKSGGMGRAKAKQSAALFSKRRLHQCTREFSGVHGPEMHHKLLHLYPWRHSLCLDFHLIEGPAEQRRNKEYIAF